MASDTCLEKRVQANYSRQFGAFEQPYNTSKTVPSLVTIHPLTVNDRREQLKGVLESALQRAPEDRARNDRIIPGQRLNHYEIIRRIGAGGMGEVYLAHDTRLERRVALKLLPPRFTENAGRLQRFEREARAASALNHPNILTIYEVGEAATTQGSVQFIATELVEGETLRSWRVDEDERLRRVLNVVIQIASALDAAHKADIVHRDIKPENVMVRPDGLVKVLDFGLAKLTTRRALDPDSNAQTLIEEVRTRPGMILGTLRYMSPEQARGRDVDARSDIFSLGVVLYELLAGEPLFAGDTDADIIAAILHKEAPPLAERLPDVPTELDRIIRKALAKDREQRYQNARDLQIDLEALKQESELSARLARSGSMTDENLAAQTSSILTSPRFSLRHVLLALPVVLLLVAALWWVVGLRGENVAPPVAFKTETVVSWGSTPGELYSVGSFSPDGKRVAYSSTEGGSKTIWVKQTNADKGKPVIEDEFTNDNPIWSPDGEEIAFFSMRGSQYGIWRIPYLGGSPQEITGLDGGGVRLRYWAKSGAGGTIYYQLKSNLYAVDLSSRQVTPVTQFDPASQTITAINISRDEKQIAYVSQDENGNGSLWVLPAHGGAAARVAGDAYDVRNPVWHPDNRRVIYSAAVDGTYQIFAAYADGHSPVQLTFGERNAFALDLPDDGTKILYGSSDEESDVWGVRIAESKEFAVASAINAELWPDVSPDGKTVAFQTISNLSQGDKLLSGAIHTASVSSPSHSAELSASGFLPKWSPDGKRLAFMRESGDTYSLMTVNAAGGEARTVVARGLPPIENTVLPYNRYQSSYFSWSPDGSRLAYISEEGGNRNVCVVSADDARSRRITANEAADLYLYCPLWSADGKRLAYASRLNRVSSDGQPPYGVWVTDTETGDTKAVFRSNYLRLLGWSRDETGLLIATHKYKMTPASTAEIDLLDVSVATGATRMVATLPAAYLYNIHLSSDRRMVAFVGRADGKDNVLIIPSTGGAAKKLTANNDSRHYFSSLAWSAQGDAIFFGKQRRFSLLSMITGYR